MVVTDAEQILFTDGPRCAGLEMILMQIRKYDRIYRACLFAVTAIDALKQINVITRCAPGAVITLFGLDCDRERGADCFTQFANKLPRESTVSFRD